MPAWNELLDQFGAVPDPQKGEWIKQRQAEFLQAIGKLRQGRSYCRKSWTGIERMKKAAYPSV